MSTPQPMMDAAATAGRPAHHRKDPSCPALNASSAPSPTTPRGGSPGTPPAPSGTAPAAVHAPGIPPATDTRRQPVMPDDLAIPPCPECTQGKHGNCDGDTWHPQLDRTTPCPCNLAGHPNQDGEPHP